MCVRDDEVNEHIIVTQHFHPCEGLIIFTTDYTNIDRAFVIEETKSKTHGKGLPPNQHHHLYSSIMTTRFELPPYI